MGKQSTHRWHTVRMMLRTGVSKISSASIASSERWCWKCSRRAVSYWMICTAGSDH